MRQIDIPIHAASLPTKHIGGNAAEPCGVFGRVYGL